MLKEPKTYYESIIHGLMINVIIPHFDKITVNAGKAFSFLIPVLYWWFSRAWKRN